MHKILLLLGVFFAGSSVILGAFAAHGLKGRLSETLLNTFQTGVQYQMYHALALLLVAVLAKTLNSDTLLTAGYLFTAGVILFSGSLYMLALTQLKFFGPITPIGGVFFILGWVVMGYAIIKHY